MLSTIENLHSSLLANPADSDLRMVYADALADAGHELDAIMQRIIARPDDDGLRLAYADELERTAGEVECAACGGCGEERYADAAGDMDTRGCPTCGGDYNRNGIGRVSDRRAEWAEFIRVQCELAARADERCRCRECQPTGQHTNGPCRSPLKPLRRRERELWPAVRERFEGEGWVPVCDIALFGGPRPTVLFSGGFPSRVRCTLDQWRGGECECECLYEDIAVMQLANAYHDAEGIRCRRCMDSRRIHGIGPRLAQAWPIAEVETEKSPFSGILWIFHDSPSSRIRGAGIPKEVMKYFVGEGQCHVEGGVDAWHFDSEPAALAALAAALIAEARG